MSKRKYGEEINDFSKGSRFLEAKSFLTTLFDDLKKNSSPDFEARITEGGEFSEFTAVPSPWRGQWSLTWGKLLTYLSFGVGICCGNDDSPTSES